MKYSVTVLFSAFLQGCQSVEHEAQHADVGEARGACSQGGGACQGGGTAAPCHRHGFIRSIFCSSVVVSKFRPGRSDENPLGVSKEPLQSLHEVCYFCVANLKIHPLALPGDFVGVLADEVLDEAEPAPEPGRQATEMAANMPSNKAHRYW